MKKEGGITLISLVITIIVLLLLAGVTIAMLIGENGILTKAKKATKEYTLAEQQEEDKIHQSAAEISKYDGTAKGKTENTKNRTLYGTTEGYTYKNPIIPKGFNAVEDGASWYYTDDTFTEVKGWNEGLVIEDASNGNQFVWVPVDGTTITYEKKDFKEQSLELSDVSTDTNAYPEGITSEEEEKEKVEKYQGFYVSRYEAGSNDAVNELDKTQGGTTTNNEVKAPVSKYGTKVLNYISYPNAIKSSKLMVDNESVKSGLITGTQWDTIMKWYENSGIITNSTRNWGTYIDLEYKVSGLFFFYEYHDSKNFIINQWEEGEASYVGNDKTDIRVFHSSGLNNNNIKKNIADLAGNFMEWNAEKYSQSGKNVRRGGAAQTGSNYAYPNIRAYNTGNYCYFDTGFRTVLYIY